MVKVVTGFALFLGPFAGLCGPSGATNEPEQEMSAEDKEAEAKHEEENARRWEEAVAFQKTQVDEDIAEARGERSRIEDEMAAISEKNKSSARWTVVSDQKVDADKTLVDAEAAAEAFFVRVSAMTDTTSSDYGILRQGQSDLSSMVHDATSKYRNLRTDLGSFKDRNRFK